jgi:nitronate monooxygenase
MNEPTSTNASGWPQNRLSSRLGIDYPIIQGALGGLATQRLTAAVSNFGGLGSFGAHGLTPSAIKDVVAEIRELTSRPFAMNLWVSMEEKGAFTSSAADHAKALQGIAGHIKDVGGSLPGFKLYTPIRFEEQARVLIDAGVAVFSFIFGIPPKEILDECRTRGIVTIGAATTPEEALALQEANVDVITASGFEAGGHRGSFLRPSEQSLTGTFALVPQVVDSVDVPVVAAGGIADARGVLAALALGAEGVQLGTAFLTCAGSGASPHHGQALLDGKAAQTSLTRGFTGRLARGIRNQLMDELNRPDAAILPYPLQRSLIRNLTSAAEAAGRTDLLQMWAGQAANIAHFTDATILLQTLVDEVAALAGPVGQWSQARRRPKP